MRTSTADSAAADTKGNSDLPFAETLFEAADRLRGSVESAEYKHLVLGLLFLKYISDSFTRRRKELEAATRDETDKDYYTEDDAERAEILEDRDEYLSENVFWVPEEARFDKLLKSAAQEDIGQRIDDALEAIENDNSEQLRGVLPRIYARSAIEPEKLGALVSTIAKIGFGDDEEEARDVLGRTYEYFIKAFARKEGHRGGEFYTPASVTELLVEMLEPFEGRVLDAACGSGGLFIQSGRFVKAHGGRPAQISILGQELNQATWRICKMNLAIHGLSGEIQLGNSLLDDKFKGKRADFVLANPPFNLKRWGAEQVADDARWEYGTAPETNANYAWIQHFIHHLTPNGRAGFVLANGSLTSMQNGEDEIREAIVRDDVVDCVVALPSKLFFTTQIAACLWFLDMDKASTGERDRRGEMLFIDARKLGTKVTSTQNELTDEAVEKIASTYRAWRGERGSGYADIEAFCKSATLEEVEKHHFVLAPGPYVSSLAPDESDYSGAERVEVISTRIIEQCADLTDSLGKVESAIEYLLNGAEAEADRADGGDDIGADDQSGLQLGFRTRMEEFLDSLYASWFIQFEPVVARVSGNEPDGLAAELAELFPSEFEETEVGLIPLGWQQVTVYEIADVIYGAPFASALFNEEREGRPIIRIRDLAHHNPKVFTTEKHPKETTISAGDLIVGMDGEFRVHRWRGPEAVLNQRMCKFVPKNGYPPVFVQQSIVRPLRYFEQAKLGTTVIHLGKRDIDTFRVVVPTPEVAAAFARIASPISDAILQLS